jgi:ribosomal protein S18 acetylase RimI-like enzyme
MAAGRSPGNDDRMDRVGPIIRPYVDDDLRQVLALDTSFPVDEVYCIARDGDSFVVASERLSVPSKKAYDLGQEVPAAEWDEAHVAVHQGELVGFTATHFAAWHRRQGIQHLYVSPGWRRRGVGRALVDTVRATAIKNGASHLWLETSNVNAEAVNAYKRMGFTLCGLDLSFYKGTPEHGEVGLLMSQDLEHQDAAPDHIGDLRLADAADLGQS